MHVLVGLVLTLSTFWLSKWAAGALPNFGLMNPAALILLALGPIGVSFLSHPLSVWLDTLRVLARAFRSEPTESMIRSSDEMLTLARAVRESRWQEAEEAIRRAENEHVRRLAPHVLARLEPDALREAVGNSAFRWMREVKLADELLQSLARLSPAFGMIGTIMGLVDLFSNMRDSASLGPGMAMALLATLYGLILCYCVYMPLALRTRGYLSSGVGEQRAIERALLVITEGRPVHEVRSALLDASSSSALSTLPVGSAEPLR